MIFITSIFIVSISTIAHGQQINAGDNFTLVGPKKPVVSWFWTKPDPWAKTDYWVSLCDGVFLYKSNLTFNCNNQNLTLINVTKDYEGTYYGDGILYRIRVIDTPKRFKRATTKVTDPQPKISSITTIFTNSTYTNLQLAYVNSSNITILPTPINEEIPKSMIGIIVAVAVGMIIIIICMITYACCYRKFYYEEKGDPLLNFDI